jgi:eukaryotic-like serine/threonine-protein kinase
MLNTTIAHYKITAKLGQGGMGEVYRATDTKLGREVAIKVLPTAMAADAERLARFQREAELLASLNHPNIAAIHGLEESGGSKALVLELVEGDTLADRLKKGPMAVEDALETCLGIAEALEAAHEKGIIHRDLKPANVKFTSDGKVKVLDFGLAKATESEPESMTTTATASMLESPTITADYTKPGTILGTAAYMSPEQARGKALDKRTDIWSFGCVLFECLTGKKLFQGEDVSETLASIIKGAPDWGALPGNTPPAIQLLLRKCLTKDRKRRLPDIAAARIDLADAIDDPSSSFIRLNEGALAESRAKSRGWLGIGIAV